MSDQNQEVHIKTEDGQWVVIPTRGRDVVEFRVIMSRNLPIDEDTAESQDANQLALDKAEYVVKQANENDNSERWEKFTDRWDVWQITNYAVEQAYAHLEDNCTFEDIVEMAAHHGFICALDEIRLLCSAFEENPEGWMTPDKYKDPATLG